MRSFLTDSKQQQEHGVEGHGWMFLFLSCALSAGNRSCPILALSAFLEFIFILDQGQIVIDLNGGASSSVVRLVTLCKPCFSTVNRLKWSSLLSLEKIYSLPVLSF